MSQNSIDFITTDERIMEVLKPLVAEVKKRVFTEPLKATDNETLGIIVSKFTEYKGESIKEVAESAFEDANFRYVKIDIGG